MIATKNKKAINNISLKNLRGNKMRNIFAIIAIALTATLFTSILTIGMSMIKSLEQSTMLQVGTSAHGSYKFMTSDELNRIKDHKLIKELSYSLIVGFAENNELSTTPTEIRYAKDKDASFKFSLPTVGKMPQNQDEIATDTIVLDKLGVPHKIGEKITLSYSINGEKHTDTFVLSGYWEKKTVGVSSMAWVSEKFIQSRLANIDQKNVKEHLAENNSISGLIFADVMFSNSIDIEGNLLKVLSDSGYTEKDIPIGVNWAYSITNMALDFGTILSLIGALLIITISGYLIIYNIFNISIIRDIKFYGMLKTIGTTSKQIKHIVRRQAFLLSILGIAIGLTLGYILGLRLIPYTMRLFNFDNISTAFSPVIFIGSAIFSFITVFISCNKPIKIASKISPVEAMHCSDVFSHRKKKAKKSINGAKIYKMALANIFRNKKKAFVVMASLSLSIILLESFYTIVKGFDMNQYLEGFMSSDFVIADKAYFNPSVGYEGQNTLSEELVKEVASLDGIKNLGKIYFKSDKHKLDQKSVEWYKNSINLNSKDYYTSEETEKIMKNGEINIHLNGLDRYVWKNFIIKKGQFDSKKFASGNYVVMGLPNIESNFHFKSDEMQNADRIHTLSYYDIGDNIEISYENGSKKTYKVMAIVNINTNLTVRRCDGTDIFIPAEEFKKQINNPVIMTTIFDVKEEYRNNVESYISNITKNKESTLSYESRNIYREKFTKVQSTYEIVGYSLSSIIAMIGMLNFINSMATNIISRRQEYAMLQSIGMTGKQLNKMLIFEGLYYALFTILIVITIGTPLSHAIVNAIGGTKWFFVYHFTLLPVLTCVPFIIVIFIAIPVIFYKIASKKSIVERLRQIE